MPSYFVHRIAGEKVLKELQDAGINPDLFIPGVQGGDLFFFYNYKRPFLRINVSKFASMLHSRRTKDFFRGSMQYIKAYGGAERDKLISYFCGYIVHYCVDKGLHPFVFGHASGTEAHNRLEFMLDAMYIEDEWKKKAEDIDIFSDLYRAPLPGSIGEWYAAMDKKLYGFGIKPVMAARALRDFAGLRRMLRHPGVYVRGLSAFIRLLTGTDVRIFLYPKKLAFEYFTKEQYEGLKEQAETAVHEATDKIREFLAFLKDEKSLDDVMEQYTDINFRGEPALQ